GRESEPLAGENSETQHDRLGSRADPLSARIVVVVIVAVVTVPVTGATLVVTIPRRETAIALRPTRLHMGAVSANAIGLTDEAIGRVVGVVRWTERPAVGVETLTPCREGGTFQRSERDERAHRDGQKSKLAHCVPPLGRCRAAEMACRRLALSYIRM